MRACTGAQTALTRRQDALTQPDLFAVGPGRGGHGASALAPGYAEWMATDAPAAILAGEPLPAPPSGTTRRRSIISRRRFG